MTFKNDEGNDACAMYHQYTTDGVFRQYAGRCVRFYCPRQEASYGVKQMVHAHYMDIRRAL